MDTLVLKFYIKLQLSFDTDDRAIQMLLKLNIGEH